MDIGYARVSSAKQDLSRQLDALASVGVTKVFADKRSGPRPTVQAFMLRLSTPATAT